MKSEDLIKWAVTGAQILKARTKSIKEDLTTEAGVPLAIAEADILADALYKLLAGALFLDNVGAEEMPEGFFGEMDVQIDYINSYL